MVSLIFIAYAMLGPYLPLPWAHRGYDLPRLVGQWTHLERLGGGIGTRGPGETQLESDRRVIRRRVMQIRGELEHVQTHRRLQREGRRRAGEVLGERYSDPRWRVIRELRAQRAVQRRGAGCVRPAAALT